MDTPKWVVLAGIVVNMCVICDYLSLPAQPDHSTVKVPMEYGKLDIQFARSALVAGAGIGCY